MAYPRSDRCHAAIHPIEWLNQPAAGHVLDLVQKFHRSFGWPFDRESLHGLIFLALRHFPRMQIDTCGMEIQPSYDALIRRLQLAGNLAQEEQGFILTPWGEERCRSTFHAALTAPEWLHALDRICEDLTILAETEGIPLVMTGPHGSAGA